MSSDVRPAAPAVSSIKMIRTLAGVAVMSGFLIVLTVKATEARIETNKRKALEAAVFAVLPDATTQATFELRDGAFVQVDSPTPGFDRVYAGYGPDGDLVGVAIEAAGMGYAGTIRTLYGYDPEAQAVVGLQVLESLETPGLGDRIGKDPVFLANFEQLDVRLDAAGDALANPVVYVKAGEKTEMWEVEGISGATISSKAVASMLDARSAELLPLVVRRLDELKEAR